MPPPRKQSTVRRDLVSQEILEKAAALFAERGFSSTTLADVAQALDMSRTALYHYVGGKDELLETLVRGLTEHTAARLGEIAGDTTLAPLDQLARAIEDMVLRIAHGPARFRLLLMSEGSLPEPLAAEYAESRRQVLRHLTTIIRSGMRAGVLRQMDEHVAAFGLLGMCNWVAWWYRPDHPGGRRAEEIAADLSSLGVASLRVGAARSADGRSGPQHAIALLREDLDYLQRTLDANAPQDEPAG